MPYACGALYGAERTRKNRASAHLICGLAFSSFDFCLSLAKSKCAKLGIAKNGFEKAEKVRRRLQCICLLW